MNASETFIGAPPVREDPIRAEIFGMERLEQHAESLAAAQRATAKPSKGLNLLARIDDNARVLLAAYRATAETVREKREITPAAEWLLDNFHTVDEQIRDIRDHLPKGYYRLLPKIAEGHLAGHPCVYGLAWAYVAHTDSRLQLETLQRFVRGYQRVQPLTIGEGWAIAIHLRVVLVENLRRLAQLIVRSRQARAKADELADRLLGLSGWPVEPVKDVLRRLGDGPLADAFAMQLFQRLRDQDPSVVPVLDRLNEMLSAQASSADAVVAREQHAQGAANVTVSNIITSMQWMSSVDWTGFFESVSLVDETLRAVPGFAEMDSETRIRCRAQIELLSRCSEHSELEVAQEALRLARDAGAEDSPDAGAGSGGANEAAPAPPEGAAARAADRRRAEEHPAFYLLSQGRLAFEKRLGFRVPVRIRLRRFYRAHAIIGYLSAIAGLTAILLSPFLLLTWAAGAALPVVVLLGILGVVPASEIAVALVHRLVTMLVEPRLHPKLGLSRGVPPELRSMVVVPTFLTSRADIDEQLERLEVHFLANSEGHLHFALLSDWTDASREHRPGDDELLAALVDGIARLNDTYEGPSGGGPRFFALHRRRLWNEGEGKWIGWERKRGKLHELNRLLRGAADTTFVPINGQPPAVPEGVRFVITLDADTRLPKRTAYRLIGAIAHPFNRPRFEPRKGRVVDGYGILQPRITPSLPTGPQSTAYQRIVSGPGGVDPYAAAISDVYQDLFEGGSFTGKGIYEVDIFEAALEGKVPENALLSHDLFEGVFAHAGLLTDVDLFEEFPTNYEVAARRNHRWVRGDWQLLPWILGRARDAAGRKQSARIPIEGRWKMMDNLRRSLVAPSSLLVSVAAWTLPGVPALVWASLIVGSIAVPAFIPVLDNLTPRRSRISKRSHLRAVVRDIFVASSQTVLALTMLADQACLMADAVARTIRRIYLTRQNLLEWVTAAQAGFGATLTLRAFYRDLRWGVVVALGAGALCVVLKPDALPVAAPFIALWVLAPALALRISTPSKVAASSALSARETGFLRLVARRTWRFFETFVDDEEHALPPDNFQEDPEPVRAHRTSPTNIGLYLLSTVSAHDFGWIGLQDTAERLEATFETMAALHRVQGHFCNWYDTRDLRPLEPIYVSTVDSGNLAGHLIAVAQACRELARQSPFGPGTLSGIGDAVRLVLESVERTGPLQRAQGIVAGQLREAAEGMSALLTISPNVGSAWVRRLEELGARAERLVDITSTLADEVGDEAAAEALVWAKAVRSSIRSHARDIEAALIFEGLGATERAGTTLAHHLVDLAWRAEAMVEAMDFRFLFDPSRKVFSIGYRVADRMLDPSCYDLLASEARLASFVAIAKGDVSPRHWFRLGRALTPVGRGAALVSWSGSMFEYLMPLLVMRQPAHSLLDLSCRLVVGYQIRYGEDRKVPWGVSESAYNVRDVHFTYQYSDFGVPGLGFKRGLGEDVVVAPYATALAAMIDPKDAVENFVRLEEAGARGAYGFYEALDYTPSRLPEGDQVAVVRAYMAHHQGMTVVALGNVVHDGVTRRRFHAQPLIQAAELLLQERTPRAVAVARPRAEEVRVAALVRDLVPPTLRHFESPHDITPRTHLLSNGRYTVMVTAAGAGFSRWGNLAVTRWREDATSDGWGSFIYLRDADSGDVWSAGYQPSGTEADAYDVVYSEDRAKIMQRRRSLSTTLEIVVSPEDDAELRRLTITNLEDRAREIDVTSYAEVVLAPQAADEAHPAFSNLFVETEFVPGLGTLLASRRPRSADEPRVWLAHLIALEEETPGALQFESDRARFLGRGRGVRTALAVVGGEPLSNTAGTVLDPIVSLRQRVAIAGRGTAHLVFTTLVARSREEALAAAEKYRQAATFERASSLAWTQAQVQLHHLRITQDEAHLFQRLANRLLYVDPSLRAAPQELAKNRGGQSGLWAYGISGDLPIALVEIETVEEREVARQLVRAHEYWYRKGIAADLVILNTQATSYAPGLQESLETMVRASQSASGHEMHREHGDVFVLRADLVPAADQLLLQAAARVEIVARRGSLSEQVVRLGRSRPGPVPPRHRAPRGSIEAVAPPVLDLEFFNGLGGFTADGREYVTALGTGEWTPAPWLNVVANPDFGFQTSEAGSGHTWSVNSRENKLTPWSNDPVSDPPGEAFYIRDEDSGLVWGPTMLPIREETSPYVARHGQGYSRFEHTAHGITLELVQFVPVRDPVKISRLTLTNRSNRKRELSVTAYAEWVLGVARGESAGFVVTEIDAATGAIFARNSWNGEFADRVAFADLGGRQTSCTGDRLEFLGRNSGLERPRIAAEGAGAVGEDRSGPRPVRRPAGEGGARAGRAHRGRLPAR